MTGQTMMWFAILMSVVALLYAAFLAKQVSDKDPGTEKMIEVAAAIREGAMAFIKREYRILFIFVMAVAIILAVANTGALKLTAVAFVIGAFCSGLAGFLGLNIATKANVRTASAARIGLTQALDVAFRGGAVMGLCVVGLGVLGLGGLFLIFSGKFGTDVNNLKDVVLPILSGFSLGASSIALFARVGGGIYTKAADVGADLVGKVEAGIPEDDPRNPATIADNVGDNVGDVCGMGADLFESYVGAIISAMVLGATAGLNGVILPLLIAAIGILASIIGTFFVKTKEGGNPQKALNSGMFVAAGLFVVGAYFVIRFTVGDGITLSSMNIDALHIWGAVVVGLVAGSAIGMVTEYYCAMQRKPVNEIVNSSLTGTATVIMSGLALGKRSTALPLFFIGAAVLVSFSLAGLFGIAIAALGMLATTGIQLAVDAYGPVADNAGGIAEMSQLGPEVRERTDSLDAVGNTTAAIGKGFAIGSAALTALALFSAFREQAGLTSIDVTRPEVMVGILLGGTLPFLFSAMTMRAVGLAANEMIVEVRRQFREIKGLMEGTAKADYARCVDISTSAALKQMIKPGLLAVVVPVIVGFGSKAIWGDAAPLGGMLVGVTVTGVLLAIFMSNAGGAWDNAKKQIEGEKRCSINGTGKGSDRHASAVIGDTVGDPYKDTSGPSLNILLKLMSVISLVIAPFLV
ncbi:MAG: sodium-translocating pyrophosphatase [Deltaproteobacteria bacterium CG11_big_fil_rev_8_21_14_0_20_42_23]|nr:MAG: sodium-translocating pyrophosphatase [Deltaproteobacteria bacterium CG11_big_fil_rev_8_21_14_0_20_42_23]PJC63500.1 MAG: sodium-translocating pyrophosphatase [Deltaproteobacteria bacterium CG_4_9_14_0_2_um_filter_42_21]